LPESSRLMLLHEFNWKKEVLEAGEPVLVDFWASWCGPCRAMNPTIEALAKDFKVCKVNVDTNQELAAHYGISSIPALLIFKDGKIAGRKVGVTPEGALRAELERLKGL
jgi:thioredoxin 1